MDALLDIQQLPAFDAVDDASIETSINQLLQDCRAELTRVTQQASPTWDNTVALLDEQEDKLNQAWSVVSHLNAVTSRDSLRQAHNACLPKLTAYGNEVGQNRDLFKIYQQLDAASSQLDEGQRRAITLALRDFHLSGIDLPPEKQQRYRELSEALALLCAKFEENVLDATNAWHLDLPDDSRLQGLPEIAMAQATEAAKLAGVSGYRLTLAMPCFHAVVTYCKDRALRQTMYDAFIARASECDAVSAEWDNTVVMADILRTREALAQLLDFPHYAAYSLATKMASSVDEVMTFLNDLAVRSKAQAAQEFERLSEFAASRDGLSGLSPWDVGFYSEALRQHAYDISQEALRPYFPIDKVLAGLFEITQKLYQVTIRERHDVATWHEQVRFFDIFDAKGQLQAQFYCDLYARPNKRSGAWMDECRVRRKDIKHQLQTPIAHLVCNFSAPTAQLPALLTHNEVETLFHEFGHGLHHMLTQVDYPSISGINGVPWDAVELPSQFYENWCWDPQGIALISGHYETGEPLPAALFDKMLAAKHFQSAMQMVRQLEFALFDFKIHSELSGGAITATAIAETLQAVRAQVAVLPAVANNRFQHSFSHIFAGGYAAGYYSYKWAEVLACDAFESFREVGVFDQTLAQKFHDEILSQGGLRPIMDMFVAFKGRKPEVTALLVQSGIAVA